MSEHCGRKLDLRGEVAIAAEVTYHDGDQDWWDVADEVLRTISQALLSDEVQAKARMEIMQYPRTSPRGTVDAVSRALLTAAGIGEGSDE